MFGLSKEPAAIQQRKNPFTLALRLKATKKFRNDRPAKRGLIFFEVFLYGGCHGFDPPKKIYPCRSVDQNHFLVFLRSRSKSILPLNLASARRLSRFSSSI